MIEADGGGEGPGWVRVPGRGRAWYRLDLHVHSELSYAADLTPEQVVAEARAAGLDGFASTEHNTTDGHQRWAAPAGEGLLVVPGQEVVTRSGHWLALGVPPGQAVGWDYRARDGVVGEHVARVRVAGGMCVAAHPFAPYPCGAFGFSYREFDAVEVWNGLWSSDRPWNADNETALAEWGRRLISDVEGEGWLPAVGSSDAHLTGQIATPHTVVLAESLTVQDVLAGLRAGRSWIAESARIELRLTVRCGDDVAGIGERRDTRGGEVVVRVAVAGVPAGSVTMHTDRGIAHRAELPTTRTGMIEWRTTAAESAFVRVEARHPDGRMAAVTNPVILI
jgi:predicted metal-dependent phosphoesterase TrpH